MKTALSAIEKHYRVSEAADLLGLKDSTLRKWILLRKIHYRKINGAVRIPESSLRALLEAGSVPARSEVVQ